MAMKYAVSQAPNWSLRLMEVKKRRLGEEVMAYKCDNTWWRYCPIFVTTVQIGLDRNGETEGWRHPQDSSISTARHIGSANTKGLLNLYVRQ